MTDVCYTPPAVGQLCKGVPYLSDIMYDLIKCEINILGLFIMYLNGVTDDLYERVVHKLKLKLFFSNCSIRLSTVSQISQMSKNNFVVDGSYENLTILYVHH